MVIVWDSEDYAPLYLLQTELPSAVARCLLRHWRGKGHVVAEFSEEGAVWRDRRYRERLMDKCTVGHYFHPAYLSDHDVPTPKTQFWGELRNVATREDALAVLHFWRSFPKQNDPALVLLAEKEIEARWPR